MLCFVPWGEATKRCQLMDYYDFIKYLAERFWFQKMLSRTSITSTMELFMTLANSCHKDLHLRCYRGSCSIVWKPQKTMIGVWVMTSTTSLCFVYNLLYWLPHSQKGWVPEPGRVPSGVWTKTVWFNHKTLIHSATFC